jgi:hypothetical protein
MPVTESACSQYLNILMGNGYSVSNWWCLLCNYISLAILAVALRSHCF